MAKKSYYTTESGHEPMPSFTQVIKTVSLMCVSCIIIVLPVIMYAVGRINGIAMSLIYVVALVGFATYSIMKQNIKPEPDNDIYLQHHRQAICEHPIDSIFTNDNIGRSFCKQCGVEIDLSTMRAKVKEYKQ
jgi:hypothetical protein